MAVINSDAPWTSLPTRGWQPVRVRYAGLHMIVEGVRG